MEEVQKRKRGRPKLPKDPNLPVRKGHRTKAELQKLAVREAEIKSENARKEAIVEGISTNEAIELESKEPDLYKGLTDQQKLIARLKLRGLTQQAIAKVMQVSQPYICKQLAVIREHQKERGKSIDQHVMVGETVSMYEEIEHRAWELYYSGDSNDKAKALQLVMAAREKHTKLLMDLGRLEKAGSTSTVTVQLSPFMEKWQRQGLKPADIATVTIQQHLSELEAPEPPDEDIEDAVIVSDEEE